MCVGGCVSASIAYRLISFELPHLWDARVRMKGSSRPVTSILPKKMIKKRHVLLGSLHDWDALFRWKPNCEYQHEGEYGPREGHPSQRTELSSTNQSFSGSSIQQGRQPFLRGRPVAPSVKRPVKVMNS